MTVDHLYIDRQDQTLQRLAKLIGVALARVAPAVFDDTARALWDDSFAQRVAR